MEELLFSYGTLQLKGVQMESFGRELIGTKEILRGFTINQLLITDKAVLQKSKQKYHPIAIPTHNQSDEIIGTLYKISRQELEQADLYEVADYKRVKVSFISGKQGWVYIKS